LRRGFEVQDSIWPDGQFAGGGIQKQPRVCTADDRERQSLIIGIVRGNEPNCRSDRRVFVHHKVVLCIDDRAGVRTQRFIEQEVVVASDSKLLRSAADQICRLLVVQNRHVVDRREQMLDLKLTIFVGNGRGFQLSEFESIKSSGRGVWKRVIGVVDTMCNVIVG